MQPVTNLIFSLVAGVAFFVEGTAVSWQLDPRVAAPGVVAGPQSAPADADPSAPPVSWANEDGIPDPEPARVTATQLNVRAAPTTDGPLIGSLARDARVTVFDVVGEWALVPIDEERAGWVSLRFLEGPSLPRFPSAPPPATAARDRASGSRGPPDVQPARTTVRQIARGRGQQTIEGRVIGVSDGDSITVLGPGYQEVRVRLANIDAPERGQPWGNRSRQMLQGMVAGEVVRVVQTDTDRHGRLVGDVFVGERYVNGEMVSMGGAWAYRQYLTDRRFVGWESSARGASLGLWAMPASQTVAPWDYRANRRAQAQGSVGAVAPMAPASASAPQASRRPARFVDQPFRIPAQASRPSNSGRCGTKRTCRQMNSCSEAQFFLRQCGVRRLDGDGDGVPCESIC